jgi:hypothetical protein
MRATIRGLPTREPDGLSLTTMASSSLQATGMEIAAASNTITNGTGTAIETKAGTGQMKETGDETINVNAAKLDSQQPITRFWGAARFAIGGRALAHLPGPPASKT